MRLQVAGNLYTLDSIKRGTKQVPTVKQAADTLHAIIPNI